ncbi:MAG TPA: SRPBCC domain-containing protein [Dyadobacter sp.]|nr:SRPBCC domain-containing protein [Dyadobacter sp.]
MKKLNVKADITIKAPVGKVWEVLVAPKFIRQWDALPEDFQDYYLEVGREIEWAGNSRIVVTEMIAQELLVESLFFSKWDIAPSECNIHISYTLTKAGDGVMLFVEIGDFSQLKDSSQVFAQYSDFAAKALGKIKALSENKV